jgi:RNA polymerase primary sigma factor
MNQAILDYHQDEDMIASAASLAVVDEVESSYQPLQGFQPEEENGLDEARRRAEKIFETNIEIMRSPEFEVPDAAEFILSPMPKDVSGVDGKPKRLPKPPTDTPPYLAALYATPLLNREQEYHQFRKMNYLKYRAESLRNDLDADWPELFLIDQIETFLSEALAIRNKIVQANLRLVVSIAKKIVDAVNSFDNLVSDGNVPLVRAAEIFDFERGTRFSTYATWAVRNSLYRSTLRNRRLRRRYMTGNEIAFESAYDRRHSSRSWENYHTELRNSLASMISQLDTRDQTIVNARFGLNGSERPLKFREIAERLSISTERVRQLMARSLNRLQGMAEESSLELDGR